jgi:hypothetical protein
VEWFTTSILPTLAQDVGMGGVVTEEEDIVCAEYMDLVYSQFATLYELIPNTPGTSTDPSKPSSIAHLDGVIDSIKTQSSSRSTDTTNHSIATSTTKQTPLSSNSTQTQVSEVNAVQFDSPQQ